MQYLQVYIYVNRSLQSIEFYCMQSRHRTRCMFQYKEYSFHKVYYNSDNTRLHIFFIPAFYMHNISRIVLTVINIYRQHDITSYQQYDQYHLFVKIVNMTEFNKLIIITLIQVVICLLSVLLLSSGLILQIIASNKDSYIMNIVLQRKL